MFLLLSSCSAQREVKEACRNKVSVMLFSLLEQEQSDTLQFEIIVMLTDTIGIYPQFSTLQMPNTSVALGHLKKAEILVLCNLLGVQYIDLPKKRFFNSLH